MMADQTDDPRALHAEWTRDKSRDLHDEWIRDRTAIELHRSFTERQSKSIDFDSNEETGNSQ